MGRPGFEARHFSFFIREIKAVYNEEERHKEEALSKSKRRNLL
jgi:hypothetical protein